MYVCSDIQTNGQNPFNLWAPFANVMDFNVAGAVQQVMSWLMIRRMATIQTASQTSNLNITLATTSEPISGNNSKGK